MIKGKLQAYRLYLKEAEDTGEAEEGERLRKLIDEWQKELDKLEDES